MAKESQIRDIETNDTIKHWLKEVEKVEKEETV